MVWVLFASLVRTEWSVYSWDYSPTSRATSSYLNYLIVNKFIITERDQLSSVAQRKKKTKN